MISLGLAGAHRTGKTTMAKLFAKKKGLEYVTANTADVIKYLGFEYKDIRSFSDRIEVQRHLVQHYQKVFLGRKMPFVSDRTPLDVAAYTMTEILHDVGTPSEQNAALEIVRDCFEIASASLTGSVLVPPGIPYVEEPGKPLPNVGFQFHYHHVIHGLLADIRFERPFWIIREEYTDLDTRVDILDTIYTSLLENIEHESKCYELN